MSCVLIFLHIPKSAGTTLNRVIERQFPPASVYAVFSPEDRRELKTFSQERRRRIQYVHGHFPFGIHKQFSRRSKYVTLIRHPVDRLISLYRFTIQEELSPYFERMTSKTFERFLNVLPPAVIDNPATRHISGVEADRNEAEMNETDYVKARTHIKQHFELVAVVEQFNRMLYLLKERFDWNWIHYTRRNVSRNKVPVDVTEEQRVRVREQNPFDMKLYQFARDRFEETFHNQPGHVRAKAENFDRANRFYNRHLEPVRALRNWLRGNR